jgi:hypothetical protein
MFWEKQTFDLSGKKGSELATDERLLLAESSRSTDRILGGCC